MQIIGVTGKSGTGKSTFSEMLSKKYKNSIRVDVDKIGHAALKQPEIIEELTENFGDAILNNNGNIDRKKLGNLVFAKKDNMQILIDLTWQYMQQELDKILASNYDTVVLEWLLLPKTKYWDKCDNKILVSSDDQQRKLNVMKRDNVSEEYFDERDNSGLDYAPYKFDYTVENHYKDGEIEAAVNKIHNELSFTR